ncbi:helix-turn-helix domain-containing protein [Streptomyces sp. NPDC094448]|uniref:helix-turn-helix domain-containing protein n=1 Tax=Streptomyces sp. NPDC094448 TaxID=3366063 RepID=UPI00382EB6AE
MHEGRPSLIGSAIKSARGQRGWTQRQLADRLNELRGYEYGGCTANDVYRWETGRRSPRDWLSALATVLELEIASSVPCSTLAAEALEEKETDVDRRELISAGAGVFAGAMVPGEASAQEGRRVGQADVERLRLALADLRRLDDYSGGGVTYPLAVRTARQTENVLSRAVYTDEVGRRMLEVLAETHQLTSWVAFDSGRLGEAKRLAQRASTAAHQAGNRILAASALSELSYLTASGPQPREAVQMARASLALAPQDALPSARVLLADRLAWACARTGDAQGVDRALGLSEDFHDRRDSSTEPEPDWVYWINRDESRIMAGRCWAELREHRRAVPVLEGIDMPYDETHSREVALFACWLAGSYIDAGDLDRAVASAGRAVALVKGTDSPRTDNWVNGVLDRLTPHRHLPTVHDLLADWNA